MVAFYFLKHHNSMDICNKELQNKTTATTVNLNPLGLKKNLNKEKTTCIGLQLRGLFRLYEFDW